MKSMNSWLILPARERGNKPLEWGLVCGLLVVGAITVIALTGPRVTSMWNDVNNETDVSSIK